MVIEFKLPELGENIESAEITKLLVEPGSKINPDQIVFEIETDKASVEVPSEVEGIIKDVFFKEGDSVKIGEVIFTIDTAAEDEKTEILKKNNNELADISAMNKKTEKESVDNIDKVNDDLPRVIEFQLPELGENIESAEITKIIVNVGNKVVKDQVLFEIETDKANVEVPSEINGIVREVKIKEGDISKVGDVVLLLETSDKIEKTEIEEIKSPKSDVDKIETNNKEVKPTSSVKAEQQLFTQKEKLYSEKSEISRKFAPASPSVRRFAREIGIDIHQVSGTGPGGRISIDDVKLHAKNLNQRIIKESLAVLKTEPLPDFSKLGEVNIQAMSNVRKKTAEHLSYAWSTIPHVTQFDKADITHLEKLRKQFSPNVESSGGKLTITAILLKICASALKIFPQFNSSIDMNRKEIIYKSYYNIGIAVDTERGLLVPVIRNVDKKNLLQLSMELKEISQKAREKKLSIEDMQGGNFSISNLGSIGGTYFTPIINSPEVAILGVSRGVYEQAYINKEFEPRLMLPLSLSYDHRIIDGADAARFIKWISSALENPFLLNIEG
ncbi:2-oxo acid dehydrogenase subunit E2 [Bacteroidota bacterium]